MTPPVRRYWPPWFGSIFMGGAVRGCAQVAVFLFLVLAATSFGATGEPASTDPDEPFSPMLLWAVFVLVTAVVCIVAAVIITAAVAVLLALGIVSSATLIGVFRGHLSSGLRAFHYQLFAALAIPGGVGATWCWARFHGPAWSGREILVIGSAAGLGSGLLLAFAVDCLARMAHRRFFAPTPEP